MFCDKKKRTRPPQASRARKETSQHSGRASAARDALGVQRRIASRDVPGTGWQLHMASGPAGLTMRISTPRINRGATHEISCSHRRKQLDWQGVCAKESSRCSGSRDSRWAALHSHRSEQPSVHIRTDRSESATRHTSIAPPTPWHRCDDCAVRGGRSSRNRVRTREKIDTLCGSCRCRLFGGGRGRQFGPDCPKLIRVQILASNPAISDSLDQYCLARRHRPSTLAPLGDRGRGDTDQHGQLSDTPNKFTSATNSIHGRNLKALPKASKGIASNLFARDI